MKFTERLDEVFIRNNIISHRRLRRFLFDHKVEVNGVRVFESGFQMSTNLDELKIDGSIVKLEKEIYIMMNKAENLICSKSPSQFYDTVYSILSHEIKSLPNFSRLHTIGRLDADTTGLLIFTTNGDFSHKLAMPDFHAEKTYEVTLEKEVPEDLQKIYIKKCLEGFFIRGCTNDNGFTSKPSHLEFIDRSKCLLTITEGKFHQVKRMFVELENKVVGLKRIAMNNLALDETLSPGEFRLLTEEEICMMAGK